MSYSWIKKNLEASTDEQWVVESHLTELFVKCSKHGMHIHVPYPFHGEVAFRTHDEERHFAGHVLRVHTRDYLLRDRLFR